MEGVAAEARPAAVPAYEEALDWGYEEPEEEKEKDAVVVSPPEPVDSKEIMNGAVNNEVVENGGDAVQNGEPEEPIRSLWFVRVPRPDNDDRSVELAQQEFDMHLATCRLLNENRRLKKLEKTDARNNTFKQLEILKVANENVKQKRNELAPMRTANLQKRTARSALLESKRQLEATTEAELDELIKKVEYELQHETLSLKEEKQHIAQLKRLKQQRPKVQTYALQTRDFESKVDTNEVVKGDQDQLERELKIFREEQAECERVFVELKALESELGKELTEMNEEYEVAMQAKNRAFEKLKAAKDERRSRNADFGENREFSRRVRGLVATGDIAMAQNKCQLQTNRMMEKLKNDEEYREEYLRLWEKQRKPPISFMVDEVSDDKTKLKTNSKTKGFTSMYEGLKVEPGQSPAEAFVERMMKESNGEAPSRPAAVSGPSEPIRKTPKPSKAEEPLKQQVDAPKKKDSKNKPDAKVKEVDNEFQLPDVIVREVLNKKPEDKRAAPNSPKKEVGNVKDQRKEKAAQRKLKKREERKQKEAEEKAAKKIADQEARERELKEMQAKALVAEKAQEDKEEEETKTAQIKAPVIPDPVIRSTKKMGGRPRPRPKKNSQSWTALAEKYMVHLCLAGAGILLIIAILYMQNA